MNQSVPGDMSIGQQPPEGDESASINRERRTFLQLAGGNVTLAAVGTGGCAAAAPKVANAVTVPPTASVALTINGRVYRLDVDPRVSLLDVLRENLSLTGTKMGCNQGACGACTVLLNGRRINSCLTLAVMHDGAAIETIEGLADGSKLHPLQAAFIEHDAFQCGFCTSGQIMSGVACIAEGHASSSGEIKSWMSGNICRCGAYPGICSAIAETAKNNPTPRRT